MINWGKKEDNIVDNIRGMLSNSASKRLMNKISEYRFHQDIDEIDICKKEYDSFYKLYKKMDKLYFRLKKKKMKLEIEHQQINKNEMLGIIHDSSFMSKEIANHCLNNFRFKWTIKYSDEIELIFFNSHPKLSKKELNIIHEIIFVIRFIKELFGRGSNFSQKVTYFPSLLKKEINGKSPKSPKSQKCLGRNECNSGLTYLNTHLDHNHIDNGDIVLFRDEEHIKVLIHEMIHSNYRDLMLIRNGNSEDFTDNFCTDYEILLNESYTEFIATILNVFYVCLKNGMKMDEVNMLLKKEIEYGIYVCNRIMNYYGIDNIQDILKVDDFCKKHLSQKTNVISYYLFKPIQMFHLPQMNSFIKKHTSKLHIKNNDGVELYRNSILNWMNEQNINEKLQMRGMKNMKNMKNIKKDKEKSLRMTLVE